VVSDSARADTAESCRCGCDPVAPQAGRESITIISIGSTYCGRDPAFPPWFNGSHLASLSRSQVGSADTKHPPPRSWQERITLP
jgi:hypothetical protein